MKNKVLLSTLLGSALLAGCTADDALDVNKVAENVNPAAPVFTVSFAGDNDMTRAAMGNTMKWQKKDKMSLFHGGGVVTETPTWSVTKNTNSNFLTTGDVRNFDAIYGMKDGEAGEQPKFTTSSMVTEGLAIMIYPADTAYIQKGVNPHITLKTEQDEETMNQTPYISEVLEITQHGNLDEPGNSHSAGYDREYELQLRRIGAQLRLAFNEEHKDELTDGEGIDIIYRNVTMEVEGDDDAYPFTTDLLVRVGQPRLMWNNSSSSLVGKNQSGHSHWKYSPWLTVAEKTNKISTTHFEEAYTSHAAVGERPTVFFTLLPYDEDDKVIKEEVGEDGETKYVPQYGDVTIKVETNFGTVTVKDGAENKWNKWNATDQKFDEWTIKDGLAEILHGIFPIRTASQDNGEYAGQIMGYYGTRYLTVNFRDLNMNGLHIIDEANLIDVAKVLKHVGLKDQTNIFYLDGNDKDSKVFRIKTQAGREAYKYLAEYTATGKTLDLVLCEDGKDHTCDYVVFENSGTEVIDVPTTLKFGRNTNNSTKEIKVQLDGTKGWMLTGTKIFTNVDVLEVGNTAVELQNTINVKNSKSATKFVTSTTLLNSKDGVINVVTEDVKLQMNTINKGVINVGSEATKDKSGVRLRMSGLDVDGLTGKDGNTSLTLINDVYGTTYEASKAQRGVINLWNRLAVVENTNARIYNYGYIEQKSASNGTVLLYSNGTVQANFAEPYKFGTGKLHTGGNIFGIFKVLSTDNSMSGIVQSTGTYAMKGFVVFEGKVSVANTDPQGFINYVKVTEADAAEGLNENFDYIEYVATADGSYRVDIGEAAPSVVGLIVPSGVTINIKQGMTLSVTGDIFLKGEVYRAGTYNKAAEADYVTYVGGDADDMYNVTAGK